MKSTHRKPYSAKQKKKQLMEKREKKKGKEIKGDKQEKHQLNKDEFIKETKSEELDIITRPPWNYDMTSEELNRNEKKVFTKWITNIIDTYQGSINYFESNLETWRQLWRVVERSDVVLMIIDVRFGTLQYNNKLANWIKSCGKGFGVILNKTDLVDKIVVEKWQKYFIDYYNVDTLYLKTDRAIEGRAEDFTIDSKRNEKE
ncbi:Guanine nucleotide-binding protein-like 1 (Trinotate prediction) [Entamoeba marina]